MCTGVGDGLDRCVQWSAVRFRRVYLPFFRFGSAVQSLSPFPCCCCGPGAPLLLPCPPAAPPSHAAADGAGHYSWRALPARGAEAVGAARQGVFSQTVAHEPHAVSRWGGLSGPRVKLWALRGFQHAVPDRGGPRLTEAAAAAVQGACAREGPQDLLSAFWAGCMRHGDLPWRLRPPTGAAASTARASCTTRPMCWVHPQTSVSAGASPSQAQRAGVISWQP
jgi:hypothetical protein